MSESFRPQESSSIDEGLRTRMEGAIELLEDALPLLDSLRYLLARVETSRDDLATLQECITQLPRIDEALDRAHRHEQASALTRAVGQRKQAALLAANERLVALGHEEAPSLRGAVSAVLDLVRRQGTAPRPGELQLLTSKGAPVILSVVLGALATWIGFAALDSDWSLILGALVAGAALYKLTPSRWILLPDRLFFPAQQPALSREVLPSSIQGLSIDGDKVSVKLLSETLELHCTEPTKLVSLLHLLKGPWLSQLASPPVSWSAVLDAVTEDTKERGRALLSSEGVLFVPTARVALTLDALTAEELPAPPSLDQLLALIAHLPEGRWGALGEHLAKAADARWFPRGALTVEDSANPSLGVVVRSGEQQVRVMFSWPSGDERQLRTLELLERLKA